MQLYLNDQLADLSDDSPIALTFQINDLAEVQNQQGNTSNQFKLPLTQRNRQILGFPDDIAFGTNLPYQQYQAKLVQDGIEIIPYGIGELNGIEQDTANITILSGNVDFFDSIDGKLYDMGDSSSQWSNYGKSLVWQPYDHTWDLDNAADSQTKTDGWIYPVIDYGLMTEDFTQPVNVQNLRPGFFIKTAIDLLLQSSGYKATGSLLADPLYPLMICQYSNGSFGHGADYQNEPDTRGISVGNNLSTQYNNGNGQVHPLKWYTITADPGNQFNVASGVFISNAINTVQVAVTIPHLYFFGRVANPTSVFSVIIYYRDPAYPSTPDTNLTQLDFSFSGYGEKYPPGQAGSDPHGWTRVSGNGGDILAEIDIYNSTLSFNTQLPQNGQVYIAYQWSGKQPATAIVFPGATFKIVSQTQNVSFGQTVQCERIFPDISQKDLLKDTFQRFGIICQTDNASKTVSFNSLADIVNNIPIANDWTSKCLNQGKQVSFQLGSYAQVNYLQYQDDTNVLPLKFGWSQINIADQTLPAIGTLFASPFAATLNRPYYGGTIAQIKTIDATSGSNDFGISVSPRILIDQKLNLAALGKTITFTDGAGNGRVVNDFISTPYFYKPDAPEPKAGYGPASLLFDDLRKKYYPQFEKILSQTKKVVRYLLLTPRDILELDLLVPVYLQQDSAYYYINKIDAWRKGQPAKVELVKLG